MLLQVQQQYADILCCADREIDLTLQKVNTLKQRKKALVQRLLISRTQVKV